MSAPLDSARPIREGEELDVVRLAAFVHGALPDIGGPLEVLQFPSGHSNLTYLLRVGDRELVLRRPPFGSKVKSAHDMGREVRILSKLADVYPLAPRPLVSSEDPSIIGAPFYIMNHIPGVILRRRLPEKIELGAEVMRRLCGAFVDNLAALHAFDYRAIGLGYLGKPEGYVTRQVTGWTKRYADAKTDEIPEVEQIAAWLAARIPPETGAVLIHNDYKFDNLVLDAEDVTRIVGVLDWEMATIGDPLMDLGTALGYWTEATDPDELKTFAFGPTYLPGSFTRQEVASRYGEKTGRDVSNMLFYFCFALFKTSVVAQQIYYRYRQGLTKDERFAAMIIGVRLLSRMAVDAAESGRL